MSVDNAGFETKAADPAGVGIPDGWTVSTLASVFDYMLFAVDVPTGYEGRAQETFELGWPGVDQWIDALPETLANFLVFDHTTTAPQLFEDFENLWELPPPPTGWMLPGTPQGATSLVYAEQYDFSGAAYESFWWGTNPLDFEPSDLEFLDLGGVGGADDFEQGWDNDTWYDGGATPDWSLSWYAVNEWGGGTNSVEKFIPLDVAFLVTDINFTDNRLVFDNFTWSAGAPVEIVTNDENGRAPTPLSYETRYFVVDVASPEHGLAIGPAGTNITLTGVGKGDNYIVGSRLHTWVTIIEI